MIYGITYSDDEMSISAEKCTESMTAQGCDQSYCYSPQNISEEFTRLNQKMFDGKRGAGCYWIFKPYIIYKCLLGLKDGDYLLYSDAGCEFINNVHHVIDAMDQDIFFFSNGHQHVHWCKADIMQAINGKQLDVHYQQVQASVIFFKVNEATRNFVKEWLLYCQMPGFIDDSPSKLPNYLEFAENRHDQAILTCLQIKYGYKLHWWPDKLWYEGMKYRWPEDKYPAILLHHRKRNNEW